MMYLPALQSHPLAETAAICGRNRKRAEEMAAKYDIPRVYIDYQEMIQHGDLEAVIVAPPDEFHYEMTLAALEAGLHVLCDKPLAMNAQQAGEMYAKAETAGVKHMVLFTYRWMPFFQYFHDLIAGGYIGRCYHFDIIFFNGFGRNPDYRWRFDLNKSNGVLGDQGAHMIDLARWLMGDITSISARLGCYIDRMGENGEPTKSANDTAIMLAEFSSGAQGVIQVSAVADDADRGMHQIVQMYGEAGSLEISVPYQGNEAGAVIRGVRSGEKQYQTLAVPDAYWGSVNRSDPYGVFTQQSVGPRLFIDAIREDRPVSPNFYDGYKAQQVIDAANEADRSGRCVRIDNSAL
jgi:predicted dehydrogenase